MKKIMINKGTQEYKMASKLANVLFNMANTSTYARYEKYARESMVDTFRIEIAKLCDRIESLNVFASAIAVTVRKSTFVCNNHAAFCSEKQAWCLACAVVENGINCDFFVDAEDFEM